jgi:hypothetical protein
MKVRLLMILLAALVLVTGAHAQKITETLTDSCSDDVAFVPTYNSPNGVPGTIILARDSAHPSTPWIGPFRVRTSPEGFIRWHCRSKGPTAGNTFDAGTWAITGNDGQLVTACLVDTTGAPNLSGVLGCSSVVSIGNSSVHDFTPEQSRCDDHSNRISVRLSPNSLLETRCEGNIDAEAVRPAVTRRADHVNSDVFAGTDGRLKELSLRPGGNWVLGDLFTASGNVAPPVVGNAASGARAPFAFGAAINSVAYRSTNGHMYELFLPEGGNWTLRDLFLASGNHAPEAAGDPDAYLRSDGFYSVIYRAIDNRIHELYVFGNGTWQTGDIFSASAIAPPQAAGDPVGYVRSDSVNAVVYRGIDNHIYELSLPAGGQWTAKDLFAASGATVPATGNLSAYVRSDGFNSVVYRGSDGHIHELFQPSGGNWGNGDLNIESGNTAPAAAGDPAGYVRSDNVNSVVYRGADNQIHEFFLSLGANWQTGSLNIVSGNTAPNAVGDPVGYIRSDNVNSVIYRGTDSHIHEFFLSPGVNWETGDLMVTSGNPKATAR